MKTDVAIVGGGPGGAASAMFLAREGIRSVIIEKAEFPRYQIGESMVGDCADVLRELGLEEKMLSRGYPIKKGGTFYGPAGRNGWFVPVMGRDEEWRLYDQFAWQVRRDDFDEMMLDEASARGAKLVHGQAIEPILNQGGSISGVVFRTTLSFALHTSHIAEELSHRCIHPSEERIRIQADPYNEQDDRDEYRHLAPADIIERQMLCFNEVC